MPKPNIIFYHDGRHPLIYMYEPPMQKEEYEAAIDELAGTSIEAVTFCLGAGRVFLHDTKVAEFWGHNVDKWPKITRHRTHLNAKSLIEAGHDPLRLVCDRAHAKNMLLYPSLIAQGGSDVRHETHLWDRSSNFRYENKHFEIGARGDLGSGFPFPDNLDFKHEAARNERFAVIEEVLNNYPVDGFELQLQARPRFFHPDEVESGRGIMTDWVRRVYEEVKKSGPDRELAIRVPHRLEQSLAIGLDVREWIDQGIVDVLIGYDIDAEHWVNTMADFRPLVEAAKGSDCRVIVAISSMVDSDRYGEAPIEMVRATACNYWAQGIDGLFMGHWFRAWPYQASFYEKLRELPHADVMAPKDKYYTLRTLKATGNPLDPKGEKPLPVNLEVGEPVKLDITISDDLPRWGDMGRVHEVLLRLRIENVTERSRLSFKLNGNEIPDGLLRKINEIYRMTSPRHKVNGGYWFIFRLDRDHWPVEGTNNLEVTLLEVDPDVITTPHCNICGPAFPHIRDVELETKYLMGKNFHRGYVDPDVGPGF